MRLRALGTSGSFLKPKFNSTCQQSCPRACTRSLLSKPIQGTLWWCTDTNKFCACNTLLCLRLCNNALGTAPTWGDKNTAVPSTRAGGLTNTACKKPPRSMASSCWRLPNSSLPFAHVTISVNTTAPISKGNQPPSNNLSRLEAKKKKSTTANTPVAAMHSHNG